MDAYLFSIFLAEDLMNFIIYKEELTESEVKNSSRKLYENDPEKLEMSLTFCEAVYNLIKVKNITLFDYATDFLLVYKKDITIPNFSRFATDTALEFFKEGYSPDLFIAYCAVVVELTLFCFRRNLDNIFEQAIGLIGTVLTAHELLYKSRGKEKDIFTSLFNRASKFNQGLQNV